MENDRSRRGAGDYYRRRYGAPGRRGGSPARKMTLPEKLTLQLIICGLILTVVLAAGLFSSGLAARARAGLKNAISKNPTVGGAIAGFEERLTGPRVGGAEEDYEEAWGGEGVSGVSDAEAEDGMIIADPDRYVREKNENARVDEDILREMNGFEDVYIKANQ